MNSASVSPSRRPADSSGGGPPRTGPPGAARRRAMARPGGPRLPWLVWGAGAGVYVLAVFHRTSLGVAGPQASARFGLSAAQLGSFVMLQLGVYAAMQIPTGILVDKFGPRRMLLIATTVMGAAQVMFALVGSYPLALTARGLLGCGDAMTYISVLRLVAGWFPARRYAVLTAYTGLLGTLGNLVATLPLTALLSSFGWTATFAAAGGLSLVYALLLLRPATIAPFREAGAQSSAGPVAGHRVWAEVKSAWRMPAGRLGFWVHLTTMSGPVVFGVLWGFPYLTQGLRYSQSTASELLMLLVLIGLVANLAIGEILSRRPVVRTPMAVLVITACLIGWLVLIGWPGGRPPIGVVIAVIAIFAIGGPASTVAFMLARDYSPRYRISTATGMVNVGGFCGSVVGVFLVGQILDIVDPGVTVRSLTAFRWAFASLALLTAFGLMRVLTWWLRARAVVLLAAARGESVPVHIRAHRWELVDDSTLAQEAEVTRAAAELRNRVVAAPPVARHDDARAASPAPDTPAPDTPATDAPGARNVADATNAISAPNAPNGPDAPGAGADLDVPVQDRSCPPVETADGPADAVAGPREEAGE